VGITSAFTDEYDVDWYSLESISLTRNKGQSRLSDKTLELTTIYVDITDDGIDNLVRYNLFGNELWDYFWDYDNSGLNYYKWEYTLNKNILFPLFYTLKNLYSLLFGVAK